MFQEITSCEKSLLRHIQTFSKAMNPTQLSMCNVNKYLNDERAN